MAQIQPGKHCVPKNVFLDILDFLCQVQVHMIMVNSKKISKIITWTLQNISKM